MWSSLSFTKLKECFDIVVDTIDKETETYKKLTRRLCILPWYMLGACLICAALISLWATSIISATQFVCFLCPAYTIVSFITFTQINTKEKMNDYIEVMPLILHQLDDIQDALNFYTFKLDKLQLDPGDTVYILPPDGGTELFPATIEQFVLDEDNKFVGALWRPYDPDNTKPPMVEPPLGIPTLLTLENYYSQWFKASDSTETIIHQAALTKHYHTAIGLDPQYSLNSLDATTLLTFETYYEEPPFYE